MFYKNYRKAGFTLMELLVVISIITLLAAVLMPALMKAWNRGAYGSWTLQKNAIKGDVNCAAYFTFEEGPGIVTQINDATSNLAYAYNPDPGGGFIPDPPGDTTLTNFTTGNFTTFSTEWNVNNSRFRGLKYGLIFDGSDDYVDCTNNQRFNMNETRLTVEAWINPASLSATRGIVSKADTGGINNYYLSINGSGQIDFGVRIGGALRTFLTTAAPVAAGQWNHIVGTYDGINLMVYHNGAFIQQTAQVGSLEASDEALEIGRRNSSNYFNGVIDEVTIYNIALSAEEIGRHYQSGSR